MIRACGARVSLASRWRYACFLSAPSSASSLHFSPFSISTSYILHLTHQSIKADKKPSSSTMLASSYLERRFASRVQQYGRLYMHSRAFLGFEHTLSSTSHFAQRFRRYKSSIAFGSSDPKDGSQAIIKPNWRPSTLRERIVNFPTGVKKLMKDYELYKNIHDASRTRLNAWTLDHPLTKKTPPETNFEINAIVTRPGRIPRRQYEQQRRATVDIGTSAPVILLWAVPMIGYVPMILGVAAPRQVLSRQFHNEFEIYHYAELEYQQRSKEFSGLAEMFWNTTPLGHRASEINIPSDKEDAAGPIIDALPLYSIFANHTDGSSKHQLVQGALQSVDSIPRKYLVKLALAIGVNQNLPGWLSPFVTEWSPKWWLQYRVRQTAQAVVEDDRLLLFERHHEDGCSSLTDVEVMDACLMRGLPVTVSHERMRQCLTNHLQMISSVRRGLPPGPTPEGFGLFTLHLALIIFS